MKKKIKKKMFLKFLIVSISLGLMSAAPSPTQEYPNKQVLVEPDIYYLYWVYTDADILFEVHVKTTGWVAFGLSPNGDMFNTDIVMTWVTSTGSVHFTDRHINAFPDRTRHVDKEQNWFPLKVMVKDGYTIAKFTRKIKICDTTNEDMDIEPGTPFIIYAWGDKFDSSNDAAYHGSNRGSKTVPLITSLNLKVDVDMNEVEITDFTVNVYYNFFSLTYLLKANILLMKNL